MSATLRLLSRLGSLRGEFDVSGGGDRAGVDERTRRALFVCRERTATRWAPRWLSRYGFDVRVASSAAAARSMLESDEPSLVLVESALGDDEGGRAYLSLLEWTADGGPPVLVIASSLRDAKKAFQAGAAEIARRPHDWQMIGRRAARVACAHETSAELARARQALARAEAEVVETRRQAEASTATDSLTELPNRPRFLQLLGKAFSAPRPAGAMCAVLFVDIDQFGSLNESLGRRKGDEMLALVGRRLQRGFQSAELLEARSSGLASATLGRLGGDKFGMILGNVTSAERLRPFFDRLQTDMGDAFTIDGSPYYLSASFGVALYPDHGDEPEEVLDHAELATAQAKSQGGATLCFYTPDLKREARRRVTLGRELRQALDEKQLELHYQPIVDAESGEITAVEALLRWRHPERGLIEPGEFMTVAEEAALMVPIESWALHEACRQLRDWLDRGVSPLRMAVNVVGRQLLRGDLLREIKSALSQARIEPRLLEIELSERCVIGRRAEVRELLAELKAIGVRVSLDDFGTGDSAIVDLRRLPVDVLKVDRSFISGDEDGGSGEACGESGIIAAAMVAMARQLRLKVIAEGVETLRQLEDARQWGCDEVQGFYFTRPRPASEILDQLTTRSGEAASGADAG